MDVESKASWRIKRLWKVVDRQKRFRKTGTEKVLDKKRRWIWLR